MSRPLAESQPSQAAGVARLWHAQGLWRTLFGIALLGVLVLSLLPPTPALPSTGWDKSNHALGFGALAFLGLRACSDGWRSVLILMFALLAYGALIEVLQSFTPDRMSEWADLGADAVGLLVGWAAHALARRVVANGPARP